MKIPTDDTLGNLAEYYHVASRNTGVTKHFPTTFTNKYAEEVELLTADAAKHLETSKRVDLPSKPLDITMRLDKAITARRSERDFQNRPISKQALTTVFYLANGIRGVQGEGDTAFYQRNVPSSGNLGSVEIYPVILNVEGITPGIYHYDALQKDLALLHEGDFRTWIEQDVLYQVELSQASVALALTCDLKKLSTKYTLRGYRLGLMDVGHVAQNIQLVCDQHACHPAGLMGRASKPLRF
jgi:SagB-type dehydrogenase family enzyme